MSQLGRNNYGGKLTKGTTSERDTISSPSSGDLHYNTTTNQMNIYTGGTWTELALTIQPNDVALLSGSTQPGSANNNNIFYKNTNPYNLQVYRNAWKILPLQLTNQPSFSYGTTIPGQSSGNRGDIFYNTTNNTLNLRRNHPASTDDQWFSIIDGPSPPPPLSDVSLGDGITQSETNNLNLYKINGDKFYVAIHKNNIPNIDQSETEKTLDIDYINTSYSATGVKVYTFTGGSSGGSAQIGQKLFDYLSAYGGGGHVMAVHSGAAGGSGTISRYMRIETANVANTTLNYSKTNAGRITLTFNNNQGFTGTRTEKQWENTPSSAVTSAGTVLDGVAQPLNAAESGEDAKTFTAPAPILQKSGSRYQQTLKYTGSGNKFNSGTTKLLQWPPSLPSGNASGAGGDDSVPYREEDISPSAGNPPNSYTLQTSYRSAHTVPDGTYGSYQDFDNFLSTSGGKDRNSNTSSHRGENIQFAFETTWPESSNDSTYGHIFYQGAGGPGGSFVYEDDGYRSWTSPGRKDILHMERTSNNPPTINNDNDFHTYYDDPVIRICINSLNASFGNNNFQGDFYAQISGGKGGWVNAGTWSSYYNGPSSSSIVAPNNGGTKGMPDYPIFLVYEGLQEN